MEDYTNKEKEMQIQNYAQRTDVTETDEDLEICEEFTEKDDVKKITEEYRNSNKLNLLITSVSPYRENNTRDYLDEIDEGPEEERKYSGEMTNEAPITSLIHRLNKKQERLDEIIYIESDKIRQPIKDGDSTADYLRRRINYYTQKTEGLLCVNYCKDDSVEIPDEPDEKAVSTAVFKVYNRILALAEGKKEVNIYIESNGGVRYVLTMLLSVTKALEKRNMNIHIAEITGMVSGDNQKDPIKIINKKKIYDTAQISGIVDEFINYGRVESLRDYAEELKKSESLSNEEKDRMDEVLDKLSKLADDLQLCRTKDLLDDFYGSTETEGIGTVISWYMKKTKEKEDDSAELSIFRHLMEGIKEELDKVIYLDTENSNSKVSNEDFKANAADNNDNIRFLPNAIQWCLNKDFIQQALTLSAERLPEYLVNTGRLELSSELQQQLDQKDTTPYEPSYYLLNHWADYRYNPVKDYFDFIIKVGKLILLDTQKENYILTEKWEKIEKEFENRNQIQELSETHLSSQEKDAIKALIPALLAFYKEYSAEFVQSEESWSPHYFDMDRWHDLVDSWMNDLWNVLEKVTGGTLKYWDKNNFFENKFEVSDKLSVTIYELLSNRKEKEHNHDIISTNINSIPKRLSFLFERIINIVNFNRLKTDGTSKYNIVIDSIFPGKENNLLNHNLKNKENRIHSATKFYVMDSLSAEHITSSMEDDELQSLIYIYSICKNQRNLSNHANVNPDDVPVAMSTAQLKVLITALLKQCNISSNASPVQE